MQSAEQLHRRAVQINTTSRESLSGVIGLSTSTINDDDLINKWIAVIEAHCVSGAPLLWQHLLVPIQLQRSFPLWEHRSTDSAVLRLHHCCTLLQKRWLEERDLMDLGLPLLLHAQESPLPLAYHLPEGRKTKLADPGLLGLLSWSMECSIATGYDLSEDTGWLLEANELLIYSTNELLWSKEYDIYLPYDPHRQEQILNGSLGGLLPLLAEIPTQEQAEDMRSTLRVNFMDSGCQLLPSLSLYDDNFEPEQPDRGAVDVFCNWLLYFGLQRFDFDDLAMLVKRASIDLVQQHGFHRYFNARRQAVGPCGLDDAPSTVCSAVISDFLSGPDVHPGLRLIDDPWD